jgi:hypothetical protein
MAYMVKEVMKKWQRGALSLLSAMIAAAALVSAPPAAAAEPTPQDQGQDWGLRPGW